MKDEKYCKARDHCYYTGEYCHYTEEYRGALHNICNLKYTAPKKILKCFICGSNYDYHFIIKESAEELKEQFTCIGEDTEKCIKFTVPIEKEVIWIDKNRKEITKNIFYTLQFINSARFMANSLSNLVGNLSEATHKIKCKYGHDDKNVKFSVLRQFY